MISLEEASGTAVRQLDAKIVDRAEALVRRAELAARGRRLVFTNGVFDLFHAGHIHYLATARALGDALFVGLNDDASVRQNKGPARPVQSLADRAAVLAGLGCVDAVVPFGAATAEALVLALRPEVYVKGADYSLDPGVGRPLPEAALVRAYGGEVRLIPLLPGRSTSDLIARVRATPAS